MCVTLLWNLTQAHNESCLYQKLATLTTGALACADSDFCQAIKVERHEDGDAVSETNHQRRTLFFFPSLWRKSLIVETPQGVLFLTSRVDEFSTKPRNVLSIQITLPKNLQIKTDTISYSSVKLTRQFTNMIPTSEPCFQSTCECTIGGSDVFHPLGYEMAYGRTQSAMNALLGSGMASDIFACVVFCTCWTGAEMRLRNRLLQLGLSGYCNCCFMKRH